MLQESKNSKFKNISGEAKGKNVGRQNMVESLSKFKVANILILT